MPLCKIPWLQYSCSALYVLFFSSHLIGGKLSFLQTFIGRFRRTMDSSQNAYNEDTTALVERLDCLEKALFRSGQSGLNGFQSWEKGRASQLTASSLVLNYRKRKITDIQPWPRPAVKRYRHRSELGQHVRAWQQQTLTYCHFHFFGQIHPLQYALCGGTTTLCRVYILFILWASRNLDILTAYSWSLGVSSLPLRPLTNRYVDFSWTFSWYMNMWLLNFWLNWILISCFNIYQVKIPKISWLQL